MAGLRLGLLAILLPVPAPDIARPDNLSTLVTLDPRTDTREA
jgi:hypothetical protein